MFIKALQIEGNKVIQPKKLPEEYLEQLQYMGYNVKLLEYDSEI